MRVTGKDEGGRCLLFCRVLGVCVGAGPPVPVTEVLPVPVCGGLIFTCGEECGGSVPSSCAVLKFNWAAIVNPSSQRLIVLIKSLSISNFQLYFLVFWGLSRFFGVHPVLTFSFISYFLGFEQLSVFKANLATLEISRSILITEDHLSIIVIVHFKAS